VLKTEQILKSCVMVHIDVVKYQLTLNICINVNCYKSLKTSIKHKNQEICKI